MMASSARHHLLHLAFFVAVLVAAATPRAGAWGGTRLFFSRTTRPQAAAADEPEKAALAAGGTPATAVPVPAADVAADPNVAAFSRPSTGGSGSGSGRGYGLYGRPEESFPPDYFRRGVHRNAQKLTTTGADEAVVPVGGRGGERAEPVAEDNGSGRGRAPLTSAEEVVPVGSRGGGERAEPFVAEDNGSGWGRPPKYYGLLGAEEGRPEEEQQQRGNNYGMSDTRLYQNGRYYYDVEAGRYGYGRESNPVRTARPEEFAGASDRRGRYGFGNAAAAGYQNYGNGNELGNGFQGEGQNGRYIP